MDAKAVNQFIKELIESLESHLIQQSSMTHVIHSLKEMQELVSIEENWLKKIFFHQFTSEDLTELENIGHKLHQTYQLSLHDVLDLIDLGQTYCLTSNDWSYNQIGYRL